jgi:hypothetical protein
MDTAVDGRLKRENFLGKVVRDIRRVVMEFPRRAEEERVPEVLDGDGEDEIQKIIKRRC